MPHSISDH